jgi:putative Mn2+ efflux pump MntP
MFRYQFMGNFLNAFSVGMEKGFKKKKSSVKNNKRWP